MEHLICNTAGEFDRPTAHLTTPGWHGYREGLSLPEDLAERLRASVIGQDEAVAAVAEAIQLWAMGLELRSHRPLGFLFCGPTGVGKTELATVLARELFRKQERLLCLDCSEFSEPHQVARLLGAPPGYVGYGTRSPLDEFLSGARGGVLLVDEFEKADEAFHRLFLQVLDAGRLGDSAGRTLDLSRLIIIATTNVGLRDQPIFGFHGGPAADPYEALVTALGGTFPIELLNRFDLMVRFRHLGRQTAQRIVHENLVAEADRMLAARYGLRLEVTETALAMVTDAGYSMQLGARNLHRAFNRMVLRPVAGLIRKGGVNERLIVNVENGDITVSDRKAALW